MRTCLSFLFLSLVACAPGADEVVTGLGADNPAVRQDMVEFAKKFDEPEVVAALCKSLEDPSREIRLEAAKSLADIMDPASAPALVALLAKEEDPIIRRETIDALGRIKDPIAVDPLLAIVDATPPDEIPLNVIWALGNLADKKALQSLSLVRDTAKDTYVLWSVTEALRNIK